MAKNCPSLQVLSLSSSKKIDDNAIRVVAQNVKRLQELYLFACPKLTDESLKAIAKFCKFLRVLNVVNCVGMSSRPGLQLTELTSLRKIIEE